MTTEKKPQPGEWWRTRSGHIAYVHAKSLHDGVYSLIGEASYDRDNFAWTADGLFYCDNTSEHDLVEPLPNCTGVDWVEPPKEQIHVRGNALDGSFVCPCCKANLLVMQRLDGKPAGRLVDE